MAKQTVSQKLAPSSPVTYIYLLRESDTGRVRYVGKANEPQKRYRAHVNHKDKQNPYKDRWITGLTGRQAVPLLEILECGPRKGWEARERFWIKRFRDAGESLVNLTDGGEGTAGYAHTEATKSKIREASLKNHADPEVKAKHHEALKARWRDGEYRARWHAAPRPPRSDETKQRQSASIRAQRARLRDENGGRPTSPWKKFRAYEGFVDPSGTPVEPIRYLAQFCRDQGIDAKHMYSVYHGSRQECQGWTNQRPEARAEWAKHQKVRAPRPSGQKHTAETREKMRIAATEREAKKKAAGFRHSEETRQRMSESQKAHWARRRAIDGPDAIG